MKTMTCKQLGGACDKQFHANTFEEMTELSKLHGIKMYHKKDIDHLEAMAKIQEMMQQPQSIKAWFESKKNEFDALPED
ncbi:MAG: DUF1059 domain-containing protein [Psychromonas sp.]|nr:DUF1059 domain-containing protein [Alteromonadales bacterium]MCP5078539.1 DUF1059 domain-containing protein [Psychromonas sp.]